VSGIGSFHCSLYAMCYVMKACGRQHGGDAEEQIQSYEGMIKDNNNWDYRSCFTCKKSYYEMGVGYMCQLHGKIGANTFAKKCDDWE